MLTLAHQRLGEPFSVLVASGSEIVRSGLSALLQSRFGCHAISSTSSWSGAQAQLAAADQPALIIVNLDLLTGDNQRALRRLRMVYQGAKVIVVGQCRQRVQILALIGAGAHGYISEAMPINEITEAIRTVLAGHIFLPDIVGDLNAAEQGASSDALTPRQEQVLQLLVRGASNKEIAEELRLAEGTVKVHLGGLFKALGVRSRTAAVASVYARAY